MGLGAAAMAAVSCFCRPRTSASSKATCTERCRWLNQFAVHLVWIKCSWEHEGGCPLLQPLDLASLLLPGSICGGELVAERRAEACSRAAAG